ncbi:MAG TPA: mechanosensitive ion channel domain-containing protein [Chitinophagaceae bacterium]
MDIKTSRKSSSEEKKAKRTTATVKHKVWTGTFIVLALICITAYFLFRLQFFNFLQAYKNFILNLLLGAFFSFLVLIASKIIEGIVSKVSHTRAIVYNLVRLIRLLSILVVVFIIISFLINNWYSLFVSLGLFSLILGFALQTPISSLIGWFYIVIRTPYKVGDRIQVSEFTGDVVEINYFDTTLWEFAGEYMTNDLPSGRLIRFPNSIVWQSEVYNYSWKKFPYIWNEIPFHIAYESDLVYVEQTIRSIAKKELGEGMEENVKELRNLIKQTPVDELEIVEYPFVNFRINANTWVEALLIYLVEPKKAASVRSRLIKKILEAFSNQPDKILFPKSNSR